MVTKRGGKRKIKGKPVEDDNVLALPDQDSDEDDFFSEPEEETNETRAEKYILSDRRVKPISGFDEKFAHKLEGGDVDDGEFGDEEEELEAIRMDQSEKKMLADEDFLIPGMEKLEAPAKKKKTKKKTNIVDALEVGDVEAVERDFLAATDEEKLKLLTKDSPELLGLLEDYKKHMEVVKQVLQPLIAKVKAGNVQTSAGMSFLETKFHIFLLYCIHIVFYMLLKVEGKLVKDHPVVRRLVELRTYVQKISPLEKKLQYNINKLLAMATLNPDDVGKMDDEQLELGALKPRADKLMPIGQEAANDTSETHFYVAPKDPLAVDNTEAKKKKEKRTGEKLKEDIERYELDNFTQYVPTKEEKRLLMKAHKKQKEKAEVNVVQREEGFDGENLDDEDLNLMQFLEKKRRIVASASKKEADKFNIRPSLSGEGGKEEEVTSDESDEDSEDDNMDDSEMSDGEDDFYQKAKEKAAKAVASKQDKALARKRQREEEEEDESESDGEGGRRTAGKKIVSNRGLVPSRKKMIPRVATKKKHTKQKKRRKSQVKDIKESQHNTYSGERKISDHVVRSRTIL